MSLVSSINGFLAFCVQNPGQCHLILQGTLPGFTPSHESLETSDESLQIKLDRATAAGTSRKADVIVPFCGR
jgi:hypothetical protein